MMVVATSVSYCLTHAATDHDDGRAWRDCRFRQLFYFENPAEENAMRWADGPAVSTMSTGKGGRDWFLPGVALGMVLQVLVQVLVGAAVQAMGHRLARDQILRNAPERMCRSCFTDIIWDRTAERDRPGYYGAWVHVASRSQYCGFGHAWETACPPE